LTVPLEDIRGTIGVAMILALPLTRGTQEGKLWQVSDLLKHGLLLYSHLIHLSNVADDVRAKLSQRGMADQMFSMLLDDDKDIRTSALGQMRSCLAHSETTFEDNVREFTVLQGTSTQHFQRLKDFRQSHPA
jgi:hypothetical protein